MLGGINMRKMEKYETPEIEITKFEIARGIMEGPGFGEETGTGGDIADVENSLPSDNCNRNNAMKVIYSNF